MVTGCLTNILLVSNSGHRQCCAPQFRTEQQSKANIACVRYRPSLGEHVSGARCGAHLKLNVPHASLPCLFRSLPTFLFSGEMMSGFRNSLFGTGFGIPSPTVLWSARSTDQSVVPQRWVDCCFVSLLGLRIMLISYARALRVNGRGG